MDVSPLAHFGTIGVGSRAMEITLLTLALTLAAATATPLADLELAEYSRVTVAIKNSGAADVTAVTWEEGAGTIKANNGTLSAAALDNLDAGESSVTTLTGDDIPSRLAIGLTSSSGTSVEIVVKGVLKSAALFPV